MFRSFFYFIDMGITVADYLKNVQYVIANIDSETDSIIERKKDEILDLNRENQLYDFGIDSNGKRIFPLYKNATILFKRQKGDPYNRVTLFDTGAFYRGFDLLNRKGTINIFSRDSKSSELQDKYGNNIFGLTIENQKKYNYEIIKPELDKFIARYL